MNNDSLINNWIALIEQNKIDEALNEFSSFLKSNSVFNNIEIQEAKKILVDKLKSKYNFYFNNENYKNAELCCKYIFQYFPNDEVNLNNYINILDITKKYSLQVLLAKYYLSVYKKNICYNILSRAYYNNENFELSIKNYNTFLELEHKTKLNIGDYNNFCINYFGLYNQTHNPKYAEKALNLSLKIIELEPNNKSYLMRAIISASKCKKFSLEKSLWQKYFSYNYQNKTDEFNYSTECFLNGDFLEWSKYYKSRFYIKNPAIYPKLDEIEWTGEGDLSDKVLLVHHEQGFGDTILSFGYMPRLVKLAKHVIFYVQDELYELFKDNEYDVEILCPKLCDIKKIYFDYHIPSMSIPIVLKLDKKNISVKGNYIKPNKNLVTTFKNKFFKNNKYKIGIAFKGIDDDFFKQRDIPLEILLKLDKLDNIQLYNFTKDIEDKILDKFKHNNVIDIVKYCNTFADTAAALENIDILITSDNVVLNLAGAMGKKTIGMFNYHYIYRWYDLSGKDCGWYKSVKPIVNNEYNDWNLSMDKTIEFIKKEIH